MTSEKLETAIQLIQADDRQAAVPILRGLIQEDHSNEDAWLLLYACMDELEHKKFCLQSVLTINPANEEARAALEALSNPEPAPVEFSWQQPASADLDRLQWDEQADAEEIVLEQKIERKKMEWEQTESERLEQEKVAQEKKEQKRIEREQAELERVEKLKIEWERTDAERSEKEKAKPKQPEQEKADPEKSAVPKINWDEWDQVQPVSEKPLKPKAVKVTYQSAPYRKPRRNWRPFFSLLGMMMLLLMFLTVCIALVMQFLPPQP